MTVFVGSCLVSIESRHVRSTQKEHIHIHKVQECGSEGCWEGGGVQEEGFRRGGRFYEHQEQEEKTLKQ